MLKNTSVPSRENNWLMAEVRPCDCGSKNTAKPRPMVLLVSSPAISMAANTMRTAKPMAAPIMSCCPRIIRPVMDIGSSAGGIGTSGAITSEIITPSKIFTSIGTLALPNGGAIESKPRMRVRGQMKEAIQIESWALVKLIMECRMADVCLPSPSPPVLLHHRRNTAEHQAHIVEHDADHPRTGDDQREEYPYQLGNEGQRRFVDLRGGLEDADDKTDHQCRCQHRRSDHQGDFHGMAAKGHYAFWSHGRTLVKTFRQ